MFKSSIAAVALLFTSASANVNQDFSAHLTGEAPVNHEIFGQMYEQFIAEYGTASPFSDMPEDVRMNNLQNSVEKIIAHNADPNKKYTKGINKFSDMSEQEFAEFFHLEDVQDEQSCSATETQEVPKKISTEEIPDTFDWRDLDGLTPVKNQGSCGSCWTFSTIGCMEAHSLIKYRYSYNLTEQQLVDCAGDFDNNGCNGGLPSHAFEYIMSAGGISTEEDYPYFAQDNECTVDKDTFVLSVEGGSVNVTVGDEVELLHAVYEIGPVSIAFKVIDGFKDYFEGIYSVDECPNGPEDVNHAVLAVGFGTEDGVDYWLVKNSWGTAWGDEGFFKIERGVNMCGVAQCNSYPADVVEVPATKKIQPVM